VLSAAEGCEPVGISRRCFDTYKIRMIGLPCGEETSLCPHWGNFRRYAALPNPKLLGERVRGSGRGKDKGWNRSGNQMGEDLLHQLDGGPASSSFSITLLSLYAALPIGRWCITHSTLSVCQPVLCGFVSLRTESRRMFKFKFNGNTSW